MTRELFTRQGNSWRCYLPDHDAWAIAPEIEDARIAAWAMATAIKPYAPRKAPRVKWRTSGAKRRRIYRRDGWQCKFCGTRRNLTLDHVVPRSRGGSDDDSNLQTLCEPCNQAKGDTMPEGQAT
jgi:hypothetical protein